MDLGELYFTSMLMTVLAFNASASEFQARALIKAVDRTILSAELSAKVVELPLQPGTPFKTGDLLVGLDCSLYQAQKLKVVAEKQASAIKLENVKKLNKLRSIGAIEVALAQSQLEQMEAALLIARLNTERCIIRAPYDGKVIERRISRFETVNQKQELIEIVNDEQLDAEVIAPASWLSWLTEGVAVKLYIDDSTTVAEGTVSAISPAIDPGSQTIMLHIDLSTHSGLIPGMSATAELLYLDKQPVLGKQTDLGKQPALDKQPALGKQPAKG